MGRDGRSGTTSPRHEDRASPASGRGRPRRKRARPVMARGHESRRSPWRRASGRETAQKHAVAAFPRRSRRAAAHCRRGAARRAALAEHEASSSSPRAIAWGCRAGAWRRARRREAAAPVRSRSSPGRGRGSRDAQGGEGASVADPAAWTTGRGRKNAPARTGHRIRCSVELRMICPRLPSAVAHAASAAPGRLAAIPWKPRASTREREAPEARRARGRARDDQPHDPPRRPAQAGSRARVRWRAAGDRARTCS